jgi:hypothetical protein
MPTIDRRTMLNRMVFGAAGAAVVAAGLAVLPNSAESTPLAAGMIGAMKPESLVEEAQVVVARRGRRRVCVWRRGRRVCFWR